MILIKNLVHSQQDHHDFSRSCWFRWRSFFLGRKEEEEEEGCCGGGETDSRDGAGYICALTVEKQLSQELTFPTMPAQAITPPASFSTAGGVCMCVSLHSSLCSYCELLLYRGEGRNLTDRWIHADAEWANTTSQMLSPNKIKIMEKSEYWLWPVILKISNWLMFTVYWLVTKLQFFSSYL